MGDHITIKIINLLFPRRSASLGMYLDTQNENFKKKNRAELGSSALLYQLH
jgi:hypothetical protein